MLMANSVRTFLCPACGAIACTGDARCAACSATLDPAVGEAAADERAQILRAYADANNLALMARSLAVAFGVSFVPLERCQSLCARRSLGEGEAM
jgi:hypothetical protein